MDQVGVCDLFGFLSLYLNWCLIPGPLVGIGIGIPALLLGPEAHAQVHFWLSNQRL